jgi:beta-glucanase (GH16 family)
VCAALLLSFVAHIAMAQSASAQVPVAYVEFYAAEFSAAGLFAVEASYVDQSVGYWTLVWQDEFNGPNGSAVDPKRWNYDVGGAWGNGVELEHYTNRPVNASIANGNLQITALRENYKGNGYTSARIQTNHKFTQLYGRFEARIKLPAGKGIWPAFWLIGDNIDTVGWPACGEVDIMEHVNHDAPIVSTLHMPSSAGSDTSIGAENLLPGSIDYSADFHVFAVEWEQDIMRFYVDNTIFQTVTRADLLPTQRWVFDHPYFIVLNVAVGGSWPGRPDSTTVFPATMLVDYVRVYQHVNNATSIPLMHKN